MWPPPPPGRPTAARSARNATWRSQEPTHASETMSGAASAAAGSAMQAASDAVSRSTHDSAAGAVASGRSRRRASSSASSASWAPAVSNGPPVTTLRGRLRPAPRRPAGASTPTAIEAGARVGRHPALAALAEERDVGLAGPPVGADRGPARAHHRRPRRVAGGSADTGVHGGGDEATAGRDRRHRRRPQRRRWRHAARTRR